MRKRTVQFAAGLKLNISTADDLKARKITRLELILRRRKRGDILSDLQARTKKLLER